MFFEDLDLNDNVLDALYDMRFDKCTPVQEKCIPEILKGHDVLGVAQTGTGKTAAYLLPVLSKLADGGYPESAINCVIMSPTRELAQQIDQAMQGFAYYLNGVSCVAVYGGNDGNRYDQELKSLSLGADVVIATPGRFISHLSLGNVDLSKVSFFILDEADRMLDMGFSEDIMTIAKKLPNTCQTIMFSATMPKKIEELAKTLLKNPVEIKLAVSKPAEKIHQMAYVCYETQKMGILKDVFKGGNMKRVIIFSGSKQKVKQIAGALSRKHINCGEMHSDLDQEQRNDIMFKFKSGQVDVLVATDIVSRGIDIDDITMVINYDVPHDVEDYVHRIGRTARADHDGTAITLVNEDDIYFFQQIESFLGKEIEKVQLPDGLGEAPEYKSNGKPKRGASAKSIRRKNRDYQSHKDKKQGNNKQRSRRPEQQSQDSSDNKVQHSQERKPNYRQKNKGQEQQNNNNNAVEAKSTSKRNNRQDKNRQTDKQTKPNNNRRNDKEATNNKDASQKTNAQQNRKPNNKKKKNNNRQRNTNEKGARRSTKYDIREELPTSSKSDSGLKALIKKPLKWLRNLGKK